MYPTSDGGIGNWLLLVGVPLLIGLWAQWRVKSAFRKWAEVRATSNVSGAQAAREILQAAQITDVDVVETNDFLGDHYNPTNKTLHLSSKVYHEPSVASLGIAAHECGHAIQHARAYAPLKVRMAIVPVTMIASNMLQYVFIGAFLFQWWGLLTIGIYCLMAVLAFQVITLPVEFDASRRAKIILQQMGMVQPGAEVTGVNRVLNAAALTYVGAVIATLGNLIYMILLRGNRD